MMDFEGPRSPGSISGPKSAFEQPLLFVTGNAGKLRESQVVFPNIQGVDLDLPEIQSLSFEDVIAAKLDVARQETRTSAPLASLVVEDTGILAPEWGNGLFPGPYTKHFLKNFGLTELVDVIGEGRRILAITVLGYLGRDGQKFFARAEIPGTLVLPRGDKGFGWDPIFCPEGQERTFGEMDLEEKTQFSMRQIAFRKLKEELVRARAKD